MTVDQLIFSKVKSVGEIPEQELLSIVEQAFPNDCSIEISFWNAIEEMIVIGLVTLTNLEDCTMVTSLSNGVCYANQKTCCW